MQILETPPQQAEHFEWLNAIEFYTNYLEIVEERMDLFSDRKSKSQQLQVDYFREQLCQLREELSTLSQWVGEHIEEIQYVPVEENRLEMDMQFIHHSGLRDGFNRFENLVNAFRNQFNDFYVKNL
jgi:hypothetical protein